jgi:DNA-directed RNA polymerase specialized sigma24 family protein
MNNCETCRSAFTELVPDMVRMTNAAFRNLTPDAREEAVQSALAIAWKSFHALVQQGRGEEPNIIRNVLWYAIKQTRAGRMIQGESRAKDAYKYARRGQAVFENLPLKFFVSDATPIPDAVSFRNDVPCFFATLSERQQRMAKDLMMGTSTKDCAERFDVTSGAVSQFRTRFKQLFEQYMAV